MAAFAPFEPQPRIAVAYSGGPDSLSLLALSQRWAAAQGGAAHAFIVDHGLRAESADEARRAAAMAADIGCASEILTWSPPAGAGHAHARAARYRLLGSACARLGVLHLLTAHHREDLAETAMMRLRRSADPFAAAAIEPQAATAWGRVLRPVLDWPRESLRAAADGFHPIQDPANADPRFERARLRSAQTALDSAGLSVDRLVEAAQRAAAWRSETDAALADFAARIVRLHRGGFVMIDRSALGDAPADLAARLLGRVIQAVAARDAPPRVKAARRLYDAICAPEWAGGALGGCRLAACGERVLVAAPEAHPDDMTLKPGEAQLWGDRWRVTSSAGGPRRIAPLRAFGVKALFDRLSPALRAAIPAIARPGLPSIGDEMGLRAVPALGWARADAAADVAFFPIQPRPFTTIWAGRLLGAPTRAHYLR